MRLKLFIGILAVILVSGCGSAPKNAAEFRQSVAGGAMGHKHDSFVAKRSVNKIAKILKRKAKQCIDGKVVERISTMNPKFGGAQSSMYITYNAKVVKSKKSVELHVRQHVEGKKVLKLQKEPEGGFFALVADVKAKTKSRSNVDIYYSKYKSNMQKGVKNWIQGKTKGCPDLSKDI